MAAITTKVLVPSSKRKNAGSDLDASSVLKKSRSTKVEATTRSQVKESNGRIYTVLVIALITFCLFQVTHISWINVKTPNGSALQMVVVENRSRVWVAWVNIFEQFIGTSVKRKTQMKLK